jgi:hypothetical protein
LVLAFLSHFVLDVVPHVDSYSLFHRGSDGITPAIIISAVTDFLFGAGLVWWLSRNRKYGGRVLLGALAGVVIDLVDNIPPWCYWFRASTLGFWVSSFHHGIQHNLPPAQWLLGLGTQAVVFGMAMLLLVPGNTRKEPHDAGSILH